MRISGEPPKFLSLNRTVFFCAFGDISSVFFPNHSHSNFSWAFLSKGERCMRLTLCEAPTRETRPDHNTGNFIPYSFPTLSRKTRHCV